jgi:hypothetical protein
LSFSWVYQADRQEHMKVSLSPKVEQESRIRSGHGHYTFSHLADTLAVGLLTPGVTVLAKVADRIAIKEKQGATWAFSREEGITQGSRA